MVADRIRRLAEFLAEARKKSGLSQREVADALGYSSLQFISNWERGLSSPPLKTIHKLAQLYKISSEKLYDEILEYSMAKLRDDMDSEFYGSKKGRKSS